MNEVNCPECGDTFDTFRAYAAHYAHHNDKNALVGFVGEQRLREMYRTMSEHEMADDIGVNQVTVHKALNEIEVDTTNPRHSEFPSLNMSQGYERITHKDSQVLHHRLLAVAWFGIDAVEDAVVHHKNTISWDNREANLEAMDQSAHIKEHGLPKSSAGGGS